ncbi:MAG: 4Fe-4S dicluster domain-containing protein [Tessaracoccus sp.]|uniref:4Fe-4S dicluster domain-containing protein n=1 Tax=Tessaracoccus sp. TaxID=1971211 RepID=UPI001ED4A6CF|nr:4Fe-4S dicluster domain-containing protein [Tessaracoccus sp.]MBK7821826.1 4Fe-4S dicluster domain-containing protein [Tessaracoccus sp.]
MSLTESTNRPAQHERHPRKGFFTDTSICIGCKACEVACKEWNRNPADSTWRLSESSYDNTGQLGADTWRHVAFIEQDKAKIEAARESGRRLVALGMPTLRPDDDAARPDTPTGTTPPETPEFRWLMSSDVCKHCTNAGCLDVCPTGALFRTEFGTVVVQADVCNGCGTCVAGCPFGVIERRADGIAAPVTDGHRDDGRTQLGVVERQHEGLILRVLRELKGDDRSTDFTPGTQAPTPHLGVAQKCTLCYDRLTDAETPACAKACPTTSITFGDHDELAEAARARVRTLHTQGRTEARLYGANPNDGVGGTGSIFLLLDEPEVYGLPPDPRVATADLPRMYARAGLAALGMVGAVALAFLTGGRR